MRVVRIGEEAGRRRILNQTVIGAKTPIAMAFPPPYALALNPDCAAVYHPHRRTLEAGW